MNRDIDSLMLESLQRSRGRRTFCTNSHNHDRLGREWCVSNKVQVALIGSEDRVAVNVSGSERRSPGHLLAAIQTEVAWTDCTNGWVMRKNWFGIEENGRCPVFITSNCDPAISLCATLP